MTEEIDLSWNVGNARPIVVSFEPLGEINLGNRRSWQVGVDIRQRLAEGHRS